MAVQKSIIGHPKKDKKELKTVANIALNRNCKAHKMTSCKIGLYAIMDKCNRPQIFVTVNLHSHLSKIGK